MKKDFSLVIPTLYGTELEKTIIQIHQGTCIPSEIIIVIPSEFQKNIDELKKYSNIKILGVDFRGQVRQRIFGFKHASCDIVIQLDDDIFVDSNCFENLVGAIHNSKERIAVAPLFKWKNSNESCYLKYFNYQRVYKYIHGEKLTLSGKITRTGWNTGIFHSEENDRFYVSEWLPGGCLAHFKGNLILENYFPFEGKAYFEDIFHSIHLNKQGIRLLVDNKAICFIDQFEKHKFKNSLDEYNFFKKYRDSIVHLMGVSKIYIRVEFLFIHLYFYYKRFKNFKLKKYDF